MDRRKQVAAIIARVVVGGLFVYAGFVKASDPGQFIRDIWNYHIFPESFAYWIAAYLPFVEILAGLALITGLQRRGARLVLAVLLVLFIVLLSNAWSRGLDISCGCFGASSAGAVANYPLVITRNLVLCAGLALELWWARSPTNPDTSNASERSSPATMSTNS